MTFLKKLFRKNPRQQTSVLSVDEASEIAGDYGTVLERTAPVPGTVADVKNLPYLKSKIKEALIIMLQDPPTAQIKDQLRTAYLCLAYWQEGVGKANVEGSFRNVDLNQSKEQILEEALLKRKEYAEYREKWAPLVEAERRRLIAELEKLKLW